MGSGVVVYRVSSVIRPMSDIPFQDQLRRASGRLEAVDVPLGYESLIQTCALYFRLNHSQVISSSSL